MICTIMYYNILYCNTNLIIITVDNDYLKLLIFIEIPTIRKELKLKFVETDEGMAKIF